MEDIWNSCLKNNPEAGHVAPERRTIYRAFQRRFLIFGSAEVLRDETVAFASKLWASGIQAELHVWARGFHEFDMFHQDAAVSQAAKKTKMAWVKRILG
jgi:acetyl esterase/lipase